MNDIGNLDLNLLKSLSVLLQERHVGRAAKRMHVSQSAMSHTLAKLRTIFDDPLFIRTAKGLEPTARALALAAPLNQVIGQVQQLIAPDSLDLAQVQRRFCIQTHDFIVHAYLASAIKSINLQAPKLIFDLQLLNPNGYLKLIRGELDMLIGAGIEAPATLLQKRLIEEEVVCLVDSNHPAKQDWGRASLFLYPHIQTSMLAADDPLLSQLEQGEQRKIGLYAESLHAQLALLTGTEYIAFLPRSQAELGCQLYPLSILPCPIPVPNITIRALWHERDQHDLLHQWVRSQLEKTLQR